MYLMPNISPPNPPFNYGKIPQNTNTPTVYLSPNGIQKSDGHENFLGNSFERFLARPKNLRPPAPPPQLIFSTTEISDSPKNLKVPKSFKILSKMTPILKFAFGV